ncbi:pickpocket protein 28-like [Stomoxys calcitrans]|uniref:pickpocket protein 28-like n=1 Tax=Stomoxys calcitrans TaxID=35570 RepID=UPI0027E33CC0|nr:pickpocket protein 28-like [Stomoxys calcitrans]
MSSAPELIVTGRFSVSCNPPDFRDVVGSSSVLSGMGCPPGDLSLLGDCGAVSESIRVVSESRRVVFGVACAANTQAQMAFFALSFITVVILAGIFIGNVYIKWNTTPVIFSINPKPTFITEEPFPALTICNMNRAYKSKAEKYQKNSVEHAMIQMLCKRDINLSMTAEDSGAKNWTSLNQFISNIAQPCENMLIACRFGGIDYNCKRIFHAIITDEGLCCAFNMVHPKFLYTKGTTPLTPEKYTNHSDMDEAVPWNAETGYPKKLSKHFYPRTAQGTGESLGLTIILNVEADQYYCSSTNSMGFKMAMHMPNERPNVREVGLLVAAGYETKARVRFEKLEADPGLQDVDLKYRQCEFQDEHELIYFASYTQLNCEAECQAESMMRHCGCFLNYMPKRFENATVCSIYHSQCVERIRLHSMLNDDDDDERECDEVCLPSCYALRFYAEFFSTPLEHGNFVNPNPGIRNFSKEYVEKNIAILTMFYNDNSFFSNKQTEFIGMTDVLSSVGGLIGLFFGFSFISLAEIIFYALIRPWRKVRIYSPTAKTNRKRKTPRYLSIPNLRYSFHKLRLRGKCTPSYFVSSKTLNMLDNTSAASTCNVAQKSLEVEQLETDESLNLPHDWRNNSMA